MYGLYVGPKVGVILIALVTPLTQVGFSPGVCVDVVGQLASAVKPFAASLASETFHLVVHVHRQNVSGKVILAVKPFAAVFTVECRLPVQEFVFF